MLEAHSPRRSLTRLVALFGVALPPLLVVSGIALDHARREARSQDLADTRVVAERLAGELNRILDVPAAQLRLAAAQAPVQQLLAQPWARGRWPRPLEPWHRRERSTRRWPARCASSTSRASSEPG
ncbi:MAG: hypothetical protein IPJ14_10380 [Kineosporiaceae bacterium]|nr:hypothetical protein [Kineosporiaceae bacterium]